MLSLVALEDLFARLGTPEAGRNLVRKARREAPVRAVQSHRSNVITKYCSRKMDRVISLESRTVELPAAVRYERDPRVLEYLAQPMKLLLDVKDRLGRPIQLPHQPDFLVLTPDQIRVEEWREEARLVQYAIDHPGRVFKGPDGWRFPAAEDHLGELGITYRLRSGSEHPTDYVQNLFFLSDYLDDDAPPPSDKALATIHDLLAERPAIHLREVLQAEGVQPDDVYKAIADGTLPFDLEGDLVHETDRAMVYRDRDTMAFHGRIRRTVPTPSLGSARLDVEIQMGMTIRFDDQEYQVGPVNRDFVFLRQGQNSTEWPLGAIEGLVQSGRLVVAGAHPLEPEGAGRLDRFVGIHPMRIQTALKRAEWVDLAAMGAVPTDKRRSVQRYRRLMALAGEGAMDQHLALVPQYDRCGRRNRQIGDNVLDQILAVAKGYHNTPTCPSKTASYLKFMGACHDAGIKKPCSFKTFAKELTRLTSVGKREGKRRAYQEAAIVWYLDLNEPIHGVRPFQYVHIDHTELQVVLVLYLPGGKKKILGRPWLTLAIDAESRAIVGFYLSFEPPSYRSCMMVVRDIVRRHGRMPETLILDNGKEFHSDSLARVCLLCGTHIRFRPAGQPRVGSLVERAFGTVQSQLINRLAGNTQVLLHARMATKSVLPDNFAEWTLPGLHGALDYYFTNIYGTENHPAHGEEPIQHLVTRLAETGLRPKRMVPYDRTFRIETCPCPVDKPTRKVDIQKGVKILNIWYFHTSLRDFRLKGKQIPVRVDPWDARHVYALVDGGWVECRSKLMGLLRNYTEVELKVAYEELAETASVKKKELTPERVAEWLKVLDAKAWDNRLAMSKDRQAEAKLIYEANGMGSIDGPPLDPSAALPTLGCHPVGPDQADADPDADDAATSTTPPPSPKQPSKPKRRALPSSSPIDPTGVECDDPYELL